MKRNDGISDKEYPGVEHYTPSTTPRPEGQVVVAVWFDGEPEFYTCDGEEGIQQLIQMYRDDWDVPSVYGQTWASSMEGHVSRIEVFAAKPSEAAATWRRKVCKKCGSVVPDAAAICLNCASTSVSR
jgi:hypothetical protein